MAAQIEDYPGCDGEKMALVGSDGLKINLRNGEVVKSSSQRELCSITDIALLDN